MLGASLVDDAPFREPVRSAEQYQLRPVLRYTEKRPGFLPKAMDVGLDFPIPHGSIQNAVTLANDGNSVRIFRFRNLRKYFAVVPGEIFVQSRSVQRSSALAICQGGGRRNRVPLTLRPTHVASR